MRALLALLLALLTTGCHSVNAALPDGRYPVRLVVVERLLGHPLGPSAPAARVVAPDEVHVRREYATDERTIAHELAHVVQWNEVGVDYLTVYWAQVLAHGYENAPFEVQARQAETRTWYREWARDVIAEVEW